MWTYRFSPGPFNYLENDSMSQQMVKRIHAVYTPAFWREYLVQMRPYLLFISGIAGAVGIAMSKNTGGDSWKWCIAFIPFFFGYGFGQALTDCFQTDTDKISAPYRPLSKGIVSIQSVLIVSITCLLASGILFYWFHPVCFWLSILAVFGLATYSYVKRNYWFAGPFYNGWIVALLPLMGYFVNLPANVQGFPATLYPYLLITLFSYGNFVLMGYLKDIEADSATRYKTFPVVFGWTKTVVAGDLFVIATIMLYLFQFPNNLWARAYAIVAIVIMIYGQAKAHMTRSRNEKGALIPILSTVRGFILLHISMVLHFQPGWWLTALCYYGLFEWVLSNRPSKYQV